MEKEDSVNLDALSEKVQQVVAKIKSDDSPEELDQIRKVIKKNVPFTLRGYFAAYLMREAFGKEENKREVRRERKDFQAKDKRDFQSAEKKQRSQSQKDAEKGAPTRAERVIPEGSKTLYVNLGKIGRIYARDLVDLVTKDTGITKEEIYAIRVHDKYSFITMSEENCNKAVAALQGTDVRGRTVQINISNREARKAAEENAE